MVCACMVYECAEACVVRCTYDLIRLDRGSRDRVYAANGDLIQNLLSV